MKKITIKATSKYGFNDTYLWTYILDGKIIGYATAIYHLWDDYYLSRGADPEIKYHKNFPWWLLGNKSI